MRIVYSADGLSMRDMSPVRVDKRDLDQNGRPVHIAFALGPKIAHSPHDENLGWVEFEHAESTPLAPGEREFDRVLSPTELEREFPGYSQRIASMQRIAAAKAAIMMAGHDDEIAAQIGAGNLKASDFSQVELAAIDARLALRGKRVIT